MTQRGFSLIELVVVLAIIVVLAAIAVPRFSRGAERASESALVRDIAILHRAVEHYAAEHGGRFPEGGGFPEQGRFADRSRVAVQLTHFTNRAGGVSMEQVGAYIYGPYLRGIPPVPVGPRRGNNRIGVAGDDVGWLYNSENGRFEPNMNP